MSCKFEFLPSSEHLRTLRAKLTSQNVVLNYLPVQRAWARLPVVLHVLGLLVSRRVSERL